MRKFFGAPDSDQDPSAQQAEVAERAALEHISFEQEQVMCDTAAQAHAEVNQDLAETDRIADVSDALEDLAIIARKIEKPTQAEMALVDNASSMAVAGTGIASEELIPAFEEIQDIKERMQAAAKSATEKAKQIWEKIMAFLKRIWEHVEEFFRNLVGTIPALRRRVAELREELTTKKTSRPTAEVVTLKAGSLALSMHGKVPTEAADLAMSLTALTEAAEWVYGPYIENVVRRGKVVVTAVSDFDWQYPASQLAAVSEILSRMPEPVPPGSFRDSSHRNPGFITKQGRSLPGNVVLLSREPILEPGNVLTNLSRQQRGGVILERTIDMQPARQFTMPILQLDMADHLLQDVDRLLEVLEDWKSSTAKSRMEQTRKEIITASNKVAAGSKGEAAERGLAGMSDEDVACYRSMLNFNSAYVQWSAKPTMALMSSALATARAVISVVRESSRLYKEDAVALKETPKPGKDKIKKTA